MENRSEIKAAESTEPASAPKQPQIDPWDPIIGSQHSFLNELECITEMVDLVLPVLKKRDEERRQRIKELAEEISNENGTYLRTKSATDIIEVIGHIKKLQQGEQMFRQGVVTSIVSKFDEFFTDVLKVSYRENPSWLLTADKKISHAEVLQIASLESFKDDIIGKEIDALMRDSHLKQLKFIDDKLKLGIEKEFPGWLEFLEITERRNLFVHAGAAVSCQYMENCSKWGVSLGKNIKEGVPLSASDDYIRKTLDCFYELSVRVAQAAVRRMFPESFESLDKVLNDSTVGLLVEERWSLAEKIFTFALSIPDNLMSRKGYRMYFLLNRCISRKFSGQDYITDLRSEDWTPFHPKFQFAVAVLEDRFEDAEKLMRSEAVRNEIHETDFKEWPLLREFRKSELFLVAYKEIFSKDFNEQLLDDATKEMEAQQVSEFNDSSEEVELS